MTDLERLAAADARGMVTSHWAQVKPDAPAVYDRFGMRTFAQVNAAANRIVRLLRAHGVAPGEHIAFLTSNRAEVMEILAASMRGGYRLTPINWHFTTEEVAYVLENSDARAVFVETRFPAALEASRAARRLKARFAIGGEAEGHPSLDTAIADFDGSDIPDPILGGTMFYTSGTTGRSKGVMRPKPLDLLPAALANYDPDTDVQLCVGPTYHGAPLTVETRTAMTAGVPVVFLDRWDSLEVLRTIQARRITHSHLVPIMFQRLLAIPAEARAQFDLSSWKYIVHGGAPCPPEVKRAMIDWVGPILNEYYSASEGGARFSLTTQEWLAKPGSVGKRPGDVPVRILDDEDRECPPGVTGRIFHGRSGPNPFVYYNDPEKTAAAYRGDEFTLGDIGYFDEDDYLFLTGRSAECIISGGVNIYPQEIDNELIKHPAVEDSSTIGAPNAEWGEEVKAVIQLRPGHAPTPALAEEILHRARQALAGYKVPRSLDFVEELPRNAAGKIQRGKVRERYWTGRDRKI